MTFAGGQDRIKGSRAKLRIGDEKEVKASEKNGSYT
jgi:hypothetical protein